MRRIFNGILTPMQTITEEDRQKTDYIFAETLEKVSLGFDPAVLKILDDPESSDEEREAIKKDISQEIVVRLMSLADSAYLGNIRQGKAASFAATILRLGAIYVKIFMIGFALLDLARDERSKAVLAKSFAAAVFGKLLAEQLKWRRESAQQVEICCLFLETGKVLMHLYERTTGEALPDDFIERCHWLLALKIAEKFELPAYIGEAFSCIFDETSLGFTRNTLSVEGVVMTAYATVHYIFSREHRLIVRSPMPDARDVFVHTPGKAIHDYLRSLGLSEDYLQIMIEESPAR
jgi:hypothetical protein